MRSAKQLTDYLAACTVCGREHKPWVARPAYAPTLASKADGHPYSSRLHVLTNSASASKIIKIMRGLSS
jgi:hypothetical protein